METQEAVAIIAQHALASAAERVTESAWEDYPEIGEYSWESVVAKVAELCPYPEGARFDEAYALLSAQANGDEDGEGIQ